VLLIILTEKEGEYDSVDLGFNRLNRDCPPHAADECRASAKEFGRAGCCRTHGKKETDDQTPEDFEDRLPEVSISDPVRAARVKEAKQPAETTRDRG